MLTNAEKRGLEHIKNMGLGLIRAIEANVPDEREAALAAAKVEEAVALAVKGLTALTH